MYYIYRLTNLVNGKTYIGQHKYKELNDGYMGSGKTLKKAKIKYGIENFKKDILVFNISERKYADLLEKTFIASERENVGVENCYNITDGGQGGVVIGHTVSEETRKKISESLKGTHPSEETIRKRAESLKGHITSEETKRKISEANKGKHCHSEETKRKISESLKGRSTWNKGKRLSEEHKKKLSDAHKGQKPWNKGKTLSEEYRKKLSEAHKRKS